MRTLYKLRFVQKQFTLSLLMLLSFFPCVNAQTYFQKVYQSAPYEQEGQDVLATADGGYLIAGYTTNSTQYDCNIYIVKTDGAGNLQWTKNYGGARPDFPYHMIATADGNYFLIGYSQSYSAGDADMYLAKIDPSGNLIWYKVYGGSGNDYGKDIIQTSDGNYLIVGWSNSPSMTDQNANLIKIDPSGNVIWSKLYGGSADDFGSSVKECGDGGFIMLGQSMSYGNGGDAYLVKTNAAGDLQWYKTFGGANYDEGVYLVKNSDESFVFVVRDSSNAGKDIDIDILKTDNDGNLIWSKNYGSTQKDTPKMVQATSDGGYIIAGISRSFGWINPDMWILKCNSGGDTTWTKHFGGVNHEHCYAVREQADGSYIAVGKTDSYGPDMDVMLLKLNSQGDLTIGLNEPLALNASVKLFPVPGHDDLTLDLGDFKANRLVLTDIGGKEIYSKCCDNTKLVTIDVRDRKSGTYILKLESETQTITKRIIIN
jgi:hypothetical protein